MAEHRVPMLGSGLRRYEDPAASRDPRIRELVTALATLEPAPAPRAHFRAELRAQLVAVAPRLVAEGPAAELRPAAERTVATEPAQARRHRALPTVSVVALRRPLGIVVGAFAVFALMLGGAVFVSKKALPGDALYAIKRANENVQLSMTHGTDRGRTYLQFASRRVGEVQDLLSSASATALAGGPNAGGALSGHTAGLVRSTLDSADDDLRNGTATLTGQAVRSRSADPLAVVIGWAPGQVAQLHAITDRLPAGDLRSRALRSEQLVSAALARATALQAALGCANLDSTGTDALGPVPPAVCTVPALPTPGTTVGPTLPVPGHRSTAPKPNTVTGNGSGSVLPGVSGGSTGGTAPTTSTAGTPAGPGLPTLPVPLPSLGGTTSIQPPITVDSCGVNVTLGPLGLNLGSCSASPSK